MKLTIDLVREIGKQMNARGIVLMTFDDQGRFGCASYGRTKQDCMALGEYVDRLSEEIEMGLDGPDFMGQK